MDKSHPKIPPFAGYEAGVAFALWLRDELKARPSEDRRIIARIADVTEDTVGNWLKGAAALSPGFAKAMAILYALDGMQTYWVRLTGEEETAVDQIRAATALVAAASRKLAEHPPSATLKEIHGLLVELQRVVDDTAVAARREQKLRAVE